jgi:hypothetical protein
MSLEPLSLLASPPPGPQLGMLVLQVGLPIGILLFIGGGALLVWSARRSFRD